MLEIRRLKKKVERKKRRILLRKRAALAAMKGIMVEQVGTGRQMTDGGMEETFAKMKGPKGMAPKMPKKLGDNAKTISKTFVIRGIFYSCFKHF